MLLARGWHGGHGGGGNFSWWSLLLLVGVMVVLLYLARRRRQRASRFGQDSAGSWPETGMAPGWYPDQNDATLMRYFDGQTWTSQTRRN
ncbi:DUF2510 domain-containing protein [Mycobacterium sp.]|uniref:DUF2510 domain-containing protein n=1 Tax=Mycobacterium sp. TaxID=1785 RepID=UPI002CD8D990|nr:DUF2510 domain-containing protein [Mycobacterium sp.]HTQ17142.1 DUF2510 domain-containing protein [Mycobacterium sp.]